MAWPFRWLGRLGNEEDGLSDEGEWLLESQRESDSNGEEEVSETEGGRKRDQKRSFDPTLPSQHLYLGDLEREGGPSGFHLDNESTTLPLLPMSVGGTIIFPGETLPINTIDITQKMLFRDAVSRGQMVVIAWDLRNVAYWSDASRPKLEDITTIGVAAEVVGMSEQGERVLGYSSLIVKLVGRQRCRILECSTRINGTMECKAVILPEADLPPLPHFHLACPTPLLQSAAAAEEFLSSESGMQVSSEVMMKKLGHIRQRDAYGSTTSVPHWVYQKYQIASLRGKILKEQRTMTISPKISGMGQQSSQYVPNDPITLSYWLVKRLPVSIAQKIELMSINCPTRRLMRGLEILQNFTKLHCANCDVPITEKEDVFSMSIDGPLASYVNPHGYVHDTLTVTQAKNFKLQGMATTENSWFPGYAWTILNCKSCYHHLGWRFDATKKHLTPSRFYGLTRASLSLKSAKEERKRESSSLANLPALNDEDL